MEHFEEGGDEEEVNQDFFEIKMEAVEILHQGTRFQRPPGSARQAVPGHARQADKQVRPDSDLQGVAKSAIDENFPARGNRQRMAFDKSIDGVDEAGQFQLVAENPGQQVAE